MSILSGDPLTQLAFSVYENRGVFAVLLGSGLSRAAEIPTGWEITLDLIRRVALAQGVQDQPNWAAWYREKTGDEPNYSTLLEELASSPEERRSILHSYIEPTDEDREEGRKIPTAAHNAVADLVRGGFVRVIITTNFDRLMENALRERGIEPTIVSSVDALSGAEPITHSSCYILKLHGDYKDARILNTEAELSGYPAPYDALLDRILDEHGLIVSGWSGEWDHALRAAFLRAPNRRYSMFWAARGTPGSGAQELIDHRRARIIPVTDADSFFRTLQQRVEILEKSQRQNPLGIELLVNSAKRFLSKPEYRIQLDELFSQEMDHVLARLDSPELAVPSSWDRETFRAYVKRYESAVEALASMAGVVGRWGDDGDLSIVLDIIRTLYAHADKVGSGIVSYLGLRSYPAMLVFTACGLGLTRAGRWKALHQLFEAPIDRKHREPVRAVQALFLYGWRGADGDAWKQIEGLEQRKTPLSDYLLTLISEWGKRFIGLTPDFELLFERFEMLGALAHLEQEEKAGVQKQLAGDARNGWAWMPVGRIGWHESNAERLVSELQSEVMKAELVQAGFAKGDSEFLELFIQNFKRIAARMRW
ncbi:SIR2 family protein [Bradyrhizobium sp. BWA-3-5]|uniref:SIR2 family protein n=1 Tax=Bradyrhizobium sp. BWA-3-5 TaxID=3080013 RepID=UPI00293E1E55|nr:SIR2 family protein [Bradyrhizobium sp. BWA-3-5]WOH68671.1 SIR2 family protein [Bradyrhizobium sp. BWA-3-5]